MKRAPRDQNSNLLAKKKDFRNGRKEYFQYLLGNHPEITDKIIQKISNCQLDIEIEQMIEELKKIKNRKATVLDEILLEVWKTTIFDVLFLRLFNTLYKQNTIENGPKSISPLSPRKVILKLL